MQSEQLGTGHALLCGEEKLGKLGGNFVITTGDCPLIRPETLKHLAETQTEGTSGALITTEVADPTGYGRIVRNKDGSVAAIVEHKAASDEQRAIREINAGFYCFDSGQFWKYIHEIRPDNPAREYYLTDMIAILLAKGRRVVALETFRSDGGAARHQQSCRTRRGRSDSARAQSAGINARRSND